ncbi:AraC family transcriptional regulator [Mesorhizobium sp. WSM4884]|uniref:AraC family transcriptional regulator n=1 Tax=Mesorhizobium sp. WSM4884 TaxID=3038542 RepID=UPI0024163ABC|nr:AraC family transcriptional regulator [Mesorhizobium sp. WSM4884]MDG4882355.1 AraC family transcriptional regulator [Mesorhizobium sp. WSM4884]
MDALSEILSSVRLGSAVIGYARLAPPWGIAVDPARGAAIHLVQNGDCWLRLPDAEAPINVSEGDIILVASGVAHALSNPVDAPVAPIAAMLSKAAAGTGNSHDSEATTLLCAKFSLDEGTPHPMISLLPPLIHLTRAQIEANPSLHLVVELLRLEAVSDMTGHDIAAPRLLDSALVFLLRAWLDSQPLGGGGWFDALRDKGIARALRLIHEAPTEPWTVNELAKCALQSRATFARRFTRLMGVPPLTYVARWRMNLAARALRETNQTVEKIAHTVGYDSAPSFSQAFNRIVGQAPGAYRNSFRMVERDATRPRRSDLAPYR